MASRYQRNTLIMTGIPKDGPSQSLEYGGGSIIAYGRQNNWIPGGRAGFRITYPGSAPRQGSSLAVADKSCNGITSLPVKRVGFPILIELDSGPYDTVLVEDESWQPYPCRNLRLIPTYDVNLDGNLQQAAFRTDVIVYTADSPAQMMAPILGPGLGKEVVLFTDQPISLLAGGVAAPDPTNQHPLSCNLTELGLMFNAAPGAPAFTQKVIDQSGTGNWTGAGSLAGAADTMAFDLDVPVGNSIFGLNDPTGGGAIGAVYRLLARYSP